jgi:hypothetical protein
MSASLTYATVAAEDDARRSAILAFIKKDTDGYQWWAESMLFFDDPKRPGHLVGNTKLFVLIDDPALDSFMASSDMERIVSTLEKTSAKFGVDWQLFLQDNPAGAISKGTRDMRAAKSVKGLLSICDAMGVDPSGLDRASILKQYRNR